MRILSKVSLVLPYQFLYSSSSPSCYLTYVLDSFGLSFGFQFPFPVALFTPASGSGESQQFCQGLLSILNPVIIPMHTVKLWLCHTIWIDTPISLIGWAPQIPNTSYCSRRCSASSTSRTSPWTSNSPRHRLQPQQAIHLHRFQPQQVLC